VVTAEPQAAALGPSFGLSEDAELLRSEIRRFAEERIRPGVEERDRTHEFPVDLIAEMSELGLLGMMVDEAYDGPGFDPLTYVVAVDEISRWCPSIGVTMSVTNSVCAWPINRYGTEEQKKHFLPPLASGGMLGGFGLTEPSAGSDAGAMKSTARRDGDEWVLNGEKAWITNAGFAGVYVVLAKTDSEAGKRGITAFIVPADTPGLTVGAPEEKLGLRASRTASLHFENCRIPADYLLGEEGGGFRIAMGTLDHSRLGIAAQALGIHRRALDLAVEYSQQRVQFGVPIAKHQAIRFSIAEIATELAAAETLTYAAAAMHDHRDAGRLASEAKLYATEAANRACYKSLQIHGGNGFSEEAEIARLYRDVRVTTIYEGTSEMQRIVIARSVLPR